MAGPEQSKNKAKRSSKRRKAILALLLLLLLLFVVEAPNYLIAGGWGDIGRIITTIITTGSAKAAGPNPYGSGPNGSAPNGNGSVIGTDTSGFNGIGTNVTGGGIPSGNNNGTAGSSPGGMNGTSGSNSIGGTGNISGSGYANCTGGGGGPGRTYLSACEIESILGTSGEYFAGIQTAQYNAWYQQDPPVLCQRSFNDTNWHVYNASGSGYWDSSLTEEWIVTYTECSGASCSCGEAGSESLIMYPYAYTAKDKYTDSIYELTKGPTGNETIVVNATVNNLVYSYSLWPRANSKGYLTLFMWKNRENGVFTATIDYSTSVPSIAAAIAADMP